MAPMHRNDVGVYDTETDTMTSISVASESTPLNMFPGIAAIGSKVYMCPNQESGKNFITIDVTDDSNPIVQKTVIPSTVTPWRIYGKDKVYGDTVAVGDKIICPPLANRHGHRRLRHRHERVRRTSFLIWANSYNLAAAPTLTVSRCILPGPRRHLRGDRRVHRD